MAADEAEVRAGGWRWPLGPIRVLIIATVLLSVVFLVLPSLDLWFSRQFYDAEIGFAALRIPALLWLRSVAEILLWAISVVVVGAFLLKLLVLPRRRPLVPGRAMLFLSATLALSAGLIVNVILKSLWGRPRPAQILDFGGDAPFVTAWHLSDYCARNCSFVSGEASSAMWLVAVALVVPARFRRAALGTALALAFAFSLNRIAFGAHFLSDVLIAWSLTLLIIAVAYHFLYIRPPRFFTEEAIDGWLTRAGLWLRGLVTRRPRAEPPLHPEAVAVLAGGAVAHAAHGTAEDAETYETAPSPRLAQDEVRPLQKTLAESMELQLEQELEEETWADDGGPEPDPDPLHDAVAAAVLAEPLDDARMDPREAGFPARAEARMPTLDAVIGAASGRDDDDAPAEPADDGVVDRDLYEAAVPVTVPPAPAAADLAPAEPMPPTPPIAAFDAEPVPSATPPAEAPTPSALPAQTPAPTAPPIAVAVADDIDHVETEPEIARAEVVAAPPTAPPIFIAVSDDVDRMVAEPEIAVAEAVAPAIAPVAETTVIGAAAGAEAAVTIAPLEPPPPAPDFVVAPTVPEPTEPALAGADTAEPAMFVAPAAPPEPDPADDPAPVPHPQRRE